MPIAHAPASETTRERDERAAGDARPQRPAVQLVERVRGDAERERERGHRPEHPVGVEDRRDRGAERDVRRGSTPCTAGGATRDVVAPAAAARARRTRALPLPSPCHDPASEREPARLRRPRSRRRARPRAGASSGQARVVAPDRRAEERADLAPAVADREPRGRAARRGRAAPRAAARGRAAPRTRARRSSRPAGRHAPARAAWRRGSST